MKRRFFSFLLVLVLVISMISTVSAASPKMLSVGIRLSFDRTTAQCGLDIAGDQLTDTISATIKLYKENTCIRTWVCSGTGFLNFYDEVSAVKNTEYTLEAVVTVNGIRKPVFTKTEICE